MPGIVAAGDVAEAADWLTGERYVHAIFPNAVAQAPIAAANLLGGDVRYQGAEAMNSLKHLGVPIVAMGTIDEPDEVLRWQSGGSLRSIYLRGGRVVGAQLAGDIRAAGVYRSLMMRRADVGRYGQRAGRARVRHGRRHLRRPAARRGSVSTSLKRGHGAGNKTVLKGALARYSDSSAQSLCLAESGLRWKLLARQAVRRLVPGPELNTENWATLGFQSEGQDL